MPIDNQTPAAATSGDLWTRLGAAAGMIISAGGTFIAWRRSIIAKAKPPHECQPVNITEALKPIYEEVEGLRQTMRKELHHMRTVEFEPLARRVNEIDGRTAADRSEMMSKINRIEEVIENLNAWLRRRLAPRDTTTPDRIPE